MRNAFISVVFMIYIVGIDSAFAGEREPYFYDKEPYVHPAIIKDLSAKPNDYGDQVVSINIDDSNDSNRYFGTYEVIPTEYNHEHMYHNSGNPFVVVRRKGACDSNEYPHSPMFGYDLVGVLDDVYVLHVSEATCGLGVWHRLMFVKMEVDCGISYLESTGRIECTRQRTLVHKLGELPLGDRYEGFVKIDGNKVFIKKDKRESSIFKQDTIIEFDAAQSP